MSYSTGLPWPGYAGMDAAACRVSLGPETAVFQTNQTRGKHEDMEPAQEGRHIYEKQIYVNL